MKLNESKMKPRVSYKCPDCGHVEESVWRKPLFKCGNCGVIYDNCSLSRLEKYTKYPRELEVTL